MSFEFGKSYPIDTLPDDLSDNGISAKDKWCLKGAMFWNDCQGWWHENSIQDYWRSHNYGDTAHTARFWMPEPPSPMTRVEILAERGLVVCAECDVAMDPAKPHTHGTPSMPARSPRLEIIKPA